MSLCLQLFIAVTVVDDLFDNPAVFKNAKNIFLINIVMQNSTDVIKIE